MKRAIAICAGMVAFLAFSGPAYGQATRTWVSGVGDDVNPCSRTAPCKTFAGAISKTAAGGEINCLDPGGFGGVTITKSLSIVCEYTEGGILSAGAGVNGIVVNALSTDTIYLRGIDFHGAGSAQNGLRVLAAASVTLENSTIRAYGASNGRGISFQPSGVTRLTVINTTIERNGTTTTGSGILVQPTGAGGNARVEIINSRIINNQFEGIRVDATGNTNPNAIVVSIENSQIGGSTTGVIAASSPGLSFIRVPILNSAIFNNGTGLTAFGSPASIQVGLSTLTANTTPTSQVSGGIVQSYGNNRTDGNTNPAVFTLPNLTEQ